jgi:hypothetical protein
MNARFIAFTQICGINLEEFYSYVGIIAFTRIYWINLEVYSLNPDYGNNDIVTFQFMLREQDEAGDSEMEQIRRQVVERHTMDFIEDSKLQRFYDYLRNLKAALVEAERYIDARDVNQLIERCQNERNYRANRNSGHGGDYDLSEAEKVRQLKACDSKITKHDQDFIEKICEVQSRHATELDKFEAEWRTMPDRYRRPSKKLIDLRHASRSLAYAGKYEEAAARKAEAESLAQREQLYAQQRLEADYRAARKKLIAKQDEEVRLMSQTAELQRELLITKRGELEDDVSKRKLVLTVKRPPRNRVEIGNFGGGPTLKGSGVRKPVKCTSEPRLPPLQPPNAGWEEPTELRSPRRESQLVRSQRK